MTLEEYKNQFTEEDAVGWSFIDQRIEEIYVTQEPRHYAPALHFSMGGNDPIDGSSIYDSDNQEFHRHIISYGMSELYYDEEKVGEQFSKWGFEFTFRIKPFEEDKTDPLWAIEVMNNLARYVYESGRWFEENHFVPANGPIRLDTDTDIVGLVFTLDPELGKLNTPHGEVSFLQMVGITSKELERLRANPTTEEVANLIEEMKINNPLLITDLNRRS
ncbi:suppressor of fused domain protein [Solitalea canadensis]|uniref:Suppressor of fused protein (SUFU) n=1 Tax=Solitalea canadensis (strain ATCC 29591 / DSM 3403 / JCM 21819 / LMG 8368 / NBRC 15130 / NCIMB 12057 / USAM 9D) TaxID=929556 RepID=H8KXR3_SOLCM|nr:suppressor of fused domain protein [Solitalea canadensis]AFD05478.1 Suppressor of fused protein (SUFU) [Solitalea canadensis DSM 3403]